METRLNLCALAFAGMYLWASSALPAEAIGRVLMTAGETSALRDGKVVPLTFGSSVEARDTLQTGQRSNLQVRLSDESILSLREQTQMRIEDYKYSGKDEGDESAVFRLVKGAFRTVTGIIGRRDNSKYAVRTPSATIGIRGTMYAAGVCDKSCFNPDGSPAPDGLYGMVIGQSHGTNRLSLTNKAGESTLRQGQIFFVANDSSAPQLLLEPPAHLIDSLAGAGKADRPTAAALGMPGASEGAIAGALGGLGDAGVGGISADSRPNALPSSLAQVALVSINFNTFQPTQNLGPGGLPSDVITTLNVSGPVFVNIGGTGIVRGQMLWTTTADMDLHMITPDGQEVAYFNRTVNFPASAPTATATLDVDNTVGINHPTAVTTFQGVRSAVENISVTGSSVPAGDYRFFTRNFSGVTTAPILLVTGDNGVTSRRFDVPALTSGATSQNYFVTRTPAGTATYSGPR
ncbi:MAG TPA: FecR domain-containing protein [Burkholderiales bacterium]|jgi:hypothetical protein|nr:FecR domain-containing protein [Burkholderiales bacterium]